MGSGRADRLYVLGMSWLLLVSSFLAFLIAAVKSWTHDVAPQNRGAVAVLEYVSLTQFFFSLVLLYVVDRVFPKTSTGAPRRGEPTEA